MFRPCFVPPPRDDLPLAVSVPLSDVPFGSIVSPQACAFRLTWDTPRLSAKCFITHHNGCIPACLRVRKNEGFGVFISSCHKGRHCFAVSVLGAEPDQRLRRLMCYSFPENSLFAGWTDFSRSLFSSPMYMIVDLLVENIPVPTINFACDSLDWTIGRHDWSEYFQPDDEISTQQLEGWSLKLYPRGASNDCQEQESNYHRPFMIISKEGLNDWHGLQVNVSNKIRTFHPKDCIPLENIDSPFTMHVEPRELPSVIVDGDTATWALSEADCESGNDIRSAPFVMRSCAYQLVIGKADKSTTPQVRVSILVRDPVDDMEFSFALTAFNTRVTKTCNFGKTRGISYPRLCTWPAGKSIEVKFSLLQYPVPPVVLSGNRGNQFCHADWTLTNARELFSRLQWGDEVRSPHFPLFGSRWQFCLGLREKSPEKTPSLALYLGSESARSAIFLMSLGPDDGSYRLHTLPMCLKWKEGQVWGFKNICSSDSLLNLCSDLTISLEMFAIPTDDLYSVILPATPTPLVNPIATKPTLITPECGFRPIRSHTPLKRLSISSMTTASTCSSSSFDFEPPISSNMDSLSTPKALVWVGRGLQKLPLVADMALFFDLALIWIDSSQGRKKEDDEIRELIENLASQWSIVGAIGEDDLSTPVADAINAKFRGRRTSGSCKNKLSQRERLSSSHPVPFGAFSCVDEAKKWICDGPGFPVIVKPVEGSGSQFCSFCINEEELDAAFRRGLKKTTAECFVTDQLLVEKYLEGEEYVVNSVTSHTHHICEVWYKTMLRKGHTILYDRQNLLAPSEWPDGIMEAARSLLTILDVTDGASHLEMVRVRTENGWEWHSMELNPRAAGHATRTMPFDANFPPAADFISDEEFWRKFGINQTSMGVYLLASSDPLPPIPPLPRISALFLQCPGNGSLRVSGIAKLCALPTFFGFDRDLAELHIGVQVMSEGSSFWPTCMDRSRNLRNCKLLDRKQEVLSFDVSHASVKVVETVDLFTVPGVVLLKDAEWQSINYDVECIRRWEQDGSLYQLEGEENVDKETKGKSGGKTWIPMNRDESTEDERQKKRRTEDGGSE